MTFLFGRRIVGHDILFPLGLSHSLDHDYDQQKISLGKISEAEKIMIMNECHKSIEVSAEAEADDDKDNTDDKADATYSKDDTTTDLIARAVYHKDEGNNLFIKASDLSVRDIPILPQRNRTPKKTQPKQQWRRPSQIPPRQPPNQSKHCMLVTNQKHQQSKEEAIKVLRVEATDVKTLF